MKQYPNLIDAPSTTSPAAAPATPAPYTHISERHIQALWYEQKLFHPLITSSGHIVHVISPGIWNGQAGPDFLKAHLQIGENVIHGNVELHLIDSSWFHHRHHCDNRYDNVVLHIALWPPKEEYGSHTAITTSQGRTVDQAYLQPALHVEVHRIADLIDLDLYPYRTFVGSGRCAKELFATLSEEQIIELFHQAAIWRLTRKNNFLRSFDVPDWQRLIYGIALCLGYKNNAYAFLDLCRQKVNSVHDEEQVLVEFLGRSGFFSPECICRWHNSTYYQRLQRQWHEDSSKALVRLHLNNVRPANHP